MERGLKEIFPIRMESYIAEIRSLGLVFRADVMSSTMAGSHRLKEKTPWVMFLLSSFSLYPRNG